MIHVKPNVKYDTLYRYLDRDLEKLKKAIVTDFSPEFYNLRDHLFSSTLFSFSLKNLRKICVVPSVIAALYGQTNTLELLSPQHKDYWKFLEEWLYTVCATELLLGKQFLDFKDYFSKFYMEYNRHYIFRRNLSVTSLTWDTEF